MILFYRRTDCHDQSADWSRNDVKNVTLPGTIMMRNDNEQCKSVLPAGASRSRNDVVY